MIEKEKEIWKDVPNFEGYYQVSDFGRVKSLDRVVIDSRGGKRFYKGRIIIGSVQKGYKITTLRGRGCGKSFNFSQLVAMAFLNHKPDRYKMVVDHRNGDTSDDRLSNLRVVTHRENLSTCFRKDSKTLSSRFTGVSWHKRAKKYRSSIQYEGELIYLGFYDNELEASKSYQKALSEINNGVFNPDGYKPSFTSKHKGVYFNKQSNKWMSRVSVNGKQKYLGIFKTELEAHNAYKEYTEKQIFKNKING